MNLSNDIELANTKAKLRQFEARYVELRNEMGEDEELREATMRSIKRYINQFKEEIARYQAHQPARR